MPSFMRAVARLLELEGGYVHDPSDVGGETKFGITKMSYPDVQINKLTVIEAVEIYRRDWWDNYGYDRIHSQRIATKVFTMAVNLGPSNAHKILQQAARDIARQNLVIDGIIGVKSLAVINRCSRHRLLRDMRAKQVLYYIEKVKSIPARQKFINGWISRACS